MTTKANQSCQRFLMYRKNFFKVDASITNLGNSYRYAFKHKMILNKYILK